MASPMLRDLGLLAMIRVGGWDLGMEEGSEREPVGAGVFCAGRFAFVDGRR